MDGARKKFRVGTIVTVLLFLIPVAVSFALFLPDQVVGREERESAFRAECGKHLEALSEICRSHALCNNGNFPGDVLRDKGVPERLFELGLLRDTSLTSCPSARFRYPRSAFCFIPGVRLDMSPKMPCVIEKITNHDRMIGVIYVDGTTAQLPHDCQNYSDLIRLFPHITPEEKELLKTHLKRLDIP